MINGYAVVLFLSHANRNECMKGKDSVMGKQKEEEEAEWLVKGGYIRFILIGDDRHLGTLGSRPGDMGESLCSFQNRATL